MTLTATTKDVADRFANQMKVSGFQNTANLATDTTWKDASAVTTCGNWCPPNAGGSYIWSGGDPVPWSFSTDKTFTLDSANELEGAILFMSVDSVGEISINGKIVTNDENDGALEYFETGRYFV